MLQASVPKAVCVAVVGALLLQSLASTPAECNQAVDPQCQGNDDGMTSLLQATPVKSEKQRMAKAEKQRMMQAKKSMSDSKSAAVDPVAQSSHLGPEALASSKASVESYDTVLLAKQDVSECFMDASVKDTFMMNVMDDWWTPCFMNLKPLDLPGAKADGSSYRFKLMWYFEGGSSVDIVWTQTSSPTEPTITGFKPISADAVNAHNYAEGATCAKFNGLGKSPEGACVIDGNGNGDCFFNCVGTVIPWNGERFIPGPMEKKASSVGLYLMTLPQANKDYRLLARQVVGNCFMDERVKSIFRMNAHNADADCYMNLDALMESGAKADGSSYHFELKWTLDDDSVVHALWSQTSLPIESTITGFQAINTYALDANGYTDLPNCAEFKGLGKSADGQCVMDGNGGDNCYFNCAGTLYKINDERFIPGPMSRKAKKFELYLIMNNAYTSKLVAQQLPNSNCHMDLATKTNMMMRNPDTYGEGCYMDLQPLMEDDAKADGLSYRFRLEWQGLGSSSSTWIHWTQTSPLWESSITGFKALDAEALAAHDHPEPGAGFDGLANSSDNECMLDGNGHGPGHWNCVGLTSAATSIPGPMSMQATGFALYLLVKPQQMFRKEVLARQMDGCLFDSNAKEGSYFNLDYPDTAKCYMYMNPSYRIPNKNGNAYRFLLRWTLEDNTKFEVMWEQEESPVITSNFDSYNPINFNALLLKYDQPQPTSCTAFHGLAESSHGQCILDGNGANECYWNCVGLIHKWQGDFIPGPMSLKAKRSDLYLLIPV